MDWYAGSPHGLPSVCTCCSHRKKMDSPGKAVLYRSLGFVLFMASPRSFKTSWLFVIIHLGSPWEQFPMGITKFPGGARRISDLTSSLKAPCRRPTPQWDIRPWPQEFTAVPFP